MLRLLPDIEGMSSRIRVRFILGLLSLNDGWLCSGGGAWVKDVACGAL